MRSGAGYKLRRQAAFVELTTDDGVATEVIPTGPRPRSREGADEAGRGPGNVGLSDREQRPPGPGEVAIAVSGAGVCGTDLHIVDDEFRSVPPVTMGHEVSGIVAEVGQGVTDEWLGARVVSETYFSTCGVCEWCRDGRTEPLPGAALDRLLRRRRLRGDGRRAGAEPAPRSGRGRRARSRAVRAARLRLPVPLRSAQPSPPATTCSSRGRGRWGCSPPRSRARSAAACSSPGWPATRCGWRRRGRSGSRRRRRKSWTRTAASTS